MGNITAKGGDSDEMGISGEGGGGFINIQLIEFENGY